MDPADQLRATPGEPVRLSASGMNLLADMASSFRLGKGVQEDERRGSELPASQLLTRVFNGTGDLLAVGDVVEIGPLQLPGNYPELWLGRGRYHELNDETLLDAIVPTGTSSRVAIAVEPILPDMVGRVCYSGICYARVEQNAAGNVGPPRLTEFAEPIAGESARLKAAAFGSIRVLQYFEEETTEVSGRKVVHCLVELLGGGGNGSGASGEVVFFPATTGITYPLVVQPGQSIEGAFHLTGFFDWTGTMSQAIVGTVWEDATSNFLTQVNPTNGGGSVGGISWYFQSQFTGQAFQRLPAHFNVPIKATNSTSNVRRIMHRVFNPNLFEGFLTITHTTAIFRIQSAQNPTPGSG